MDEGAEKPKIAVYFILTIFACSLISFGAGVNLTWVSPVLSKLTSNKTDLAVNPIGRPITLSEASWIGSIFAIGGMLGAFAGGYTNELIGRKWTLIILVAVVYVISFAILAFSKAVFLYSLGRLISGFSQGSYLTVMPIYLGEISESKTRGAVMSSTTILLAIGSLYSFCLGSYVSLKWYSFFSGCWGAFFVLIFLFCPESPYYLVYKDQNEEAEKSLMLLRSQNQSEINESLKLIEKTIEIDKSNKASFWTLWKSKSLRRAFMLCFILKMITQFSGFIAVQTYLDLILQLSNDIINPNVSAIITEIMRIMTGIVTILTIDRCGRKVLVHVSTVGVIIANFSIGCYFILKDNDYSIDYVYWIPNFNLVLLICMLYLGLFPVSLNIPGEILPSPFKSAAAGIFIIQGWILSFVFSKLFLVIGEMIGFGPVFCFFSFSCIIGEIWIFFNMIETKGKTFLEIQEMLNR